MLFYIKFICLFTLCVFVSLFEYLLTELQLNISALVAI